MNTKVPFFSTILTTFLIISAAFLMQAGSAIAGDFQIYQSERYLSRRRFRFKDKNYNSASTRQYSQSSHYQRTTVDLDSSDLRLPYLLDISATPGARLMGQVTVDGIVIQELSSSRVSINLSPYLRGDRKTVEISGRYRPEWASVQIEFSGPDTTITQQTSGNGLLRHVLVFDMQ